MTITIDANANTIIESEKLTAFTTIGDGLIPFVNNPWNQWWP